MNPTANPKLPVLRHQTWNAMIDEIMRRLPIKFVRFGQRWTHPWSIVPSWDPEREEWLLRIKPGFVNGLDAEIDLHGLTSNAAKQQLLHFLNHCAKAGYRCVHIVHGTGYRSADNHPVLKNKLNLWLRQHKDVQAFCSAPPKDGGTGAVFVLLQLAGKFSRHDDSESSL